MPNAAAVASRANAADWLRVAPIWARSRRRRDGHFWPTPMHAPLCHRGEIETVFVKHFELVRPWQRVVPFQASEKVGHS